MKSIVDYTNELKDFFASKQALTNEAVTRSKVGAHNLIPLSLAYIKEKSDDGTWVGNKYTWNNVEFTVNTDSDGNVTSVNVNTSGASATTSMVLAKKVFGNTALSTYSYPTDGEYTISGGENVTTENSDIQIMYYTTGQITIRIASGAVISNKLVYPMIRLATDPNTDFEPYAPTNLELVGIKERVTSTEFASAVDISSYTSGDYTTPNDGYASVVNITGGTGYVGIRPSGTVNDYVTIGGAEGRYSCFVRKGMKLRCYNTTNGTFKFVPFSY